MQNVKIGIQTRSLHQPIKQALHTAARLGADGVEIDARTELPPTELSRTGLRQFRRLLEDLNLRVSAVAFPTRRGYDEPQDLERRVMATQAATSSIPPAVAPISRSVVALLPTAQESARGRGPCRRYCAVRVRGRKRGITRFQCGSAGTSLYAQLSTRGIGSRVEM